MDNTSINIYLAIGTLILGWSLGIIGTVINEKLKRRSTKKDITNGIKTELNELQIHLSSVCLISVCEIGNFNKEFYQWLKPYFIKFYESTEFLIPKEIKDKTPKITEMNDEIVFMLIQTAFVKNATTNLPTNFTYQNITTPYIDLKINDISLLSSSLQKALITLKRDINFMNGDINQIWFYHTKTFESINQNNFAIVTANIKTIYGRIARRSKIMVNNITNILEEID